MNPNSKRQNNRLQFAALLRWVVITAFLGVSGLSYLYLKNQLFTLGSHRRAMEGELRDLIAQINVLENRVASLTSFTALQRKMDDGFLKMVPIAEHVVAHVRPQEVSRRAAADASLGNQYQTVSHDTAPRR